MEGVTSLYKGVKGYWKRRGYTRLNEGSRRRRRRSGSRVESPGDGSSPRRRFWRIKLSPRLKLKLRRFSLKKLLIKLRDGYVNMMMKLANSPFVSGGVGGYGGEGMVGFGIRPLKEYDEKMIVEIYKSFVLAQGMVPTDAAKVASRHGTSASVTS